VITVLGLRATRPAWATLSSGGRGEDGYFDAQLGDNLLAACAAVLGISSSPADVCAHGRIDSLILASGPAIASGRRIETQW